MAINAVCDECRKDFDGSEIYCSDCFAEKEGIIKDLESDIDNLKEEIKGLETELKEAQK